LLFITQLNFATVPEYGSTIELHKPVITRLKKCRLRYGYNTVLDKNYKLR